MNNNRRQSGFSLTEVLIATGIMAIGLVMVATVFPVGVKLTTLTTERTVGSVVADEAFAKIKLYGLRNFINWPVAQIALNGGATNAQAQAMTEATCTEFVFALQGNLESGADAYYRTMDDEFRWPGVDGLFGTVDDILDTNYTMLSEFMYPSTIMSAGQSQNYHWSALCKRVGPKDVQVTVFVNRKIAAGAKFRSWNYEVSTIDYVANTNLTDGSAWPSPVPLNMTFTYSAVDPSLNQQLAIDTNDPQVIQGSQSFAVSDIPYFFDDGYTIVDDLTGKIYRVLEVQDVDGNNVPDTLVLMEVWQWIGYPAIPAAGYAETRTIWVVPPAVGSDRYPCVGVYQKVVRFDDIN